MSVLSLIIKREYRARVRNKSFLIMTFLSPLIVVGMIMLITYLTQLNSDTKRTIVLVDETGLFTSDFTNTDQTTYLNLSEQGLDSARGLAEKEEYYGLIHIPDNRENLANSVRFYGKETPGFGLVEAIEKKIEKKLSNLQKQLKYPL